MNTDEKKIINFFKKKKDWQPFYEYVFVFYVSVRRQNQQTKYVRIKIKMNRSEKLKLVSSDGQEFEVDRLVIGISGTLTDLLESVDSNDTSAIPLGNVDGITLKKLLDYCEYHRGNPPVLDTDRVALTDWEKQYIDIPIPELFKLLLAANYLAVVPLLHLGCKQSASILKNENMQTIKEMFGITKDFTLEEEERARKDPAWIDTPSL